MKHSRTVKFRPRFNVLDILVLFCCLLGPLSAYAQTELNYEIDVTIRDDHRKLEGVMQVDLTNTSTAALSEVKLLLYPNLYAKPPANLNDVNLKWNYPYEFNPAQITIESSNETITVGQDGLVATVHLSGALPPGQSKQLNLAFTTVVPKKYGTFGRYRRVLTLNGGWHPIVPALNKDGKWLVDAPLPLANYQVSIKQKTGQLWCNRSAWEKNQGNSLVCSTAQTRFPTIVSAHKLRRRETKETTFFFSGIRRNGREEQIMAAVDRVNAFADKTLGSAKSPIVVEVPMRTELAEAGGQGIVLLSDRAMKVLPGLRKYHVANIYQAVLMSRLQEHVNKLEETAHAQWVLEATAWYLTELLLKEDFKGKRDARDLPLVRAFGFIPAIDQVVYTPQFPFVSSYYNLVPGIARNDISRFNRSVAHGRKIYGKLVDFYGKDRVETVFNQYVSSSNQNAFTDMLVQLVEDESYPPQSFLQQWLAPLPRINYSIVEHSKEKRGDEYHYEIQLRKTGPTNFTEPVNIAIKDSSDQITHYHWLATEAEHTIEFVTKHKVRVVHIDPAHRTLDRYLVDNRKPSQYKFILTGSNIAIDFNSGATQLFAATQLRKRYGGLNRYNFAFALDETNFGFSVGYSRLFGALIDRLRLNHGLGASYSFNVLDDDFLVVNGQSISPSGNSTKLSVSYGFGNRLAFFNPLQGIGASIFFTAGLKALGGDFNFFRTGAGVSQIVPINPHHLIAWRSSFGIAGGKDIPPQEQFIVGGINSLRGFSSNTLSLIGRNNLRASVEYRHSYFYDLDINLFHIVRVRKLQGAFFADGASVTDTELDEFVSGREQSDFNLGGLFDVDNMAANVGWGLRIFYDALGIRTMMVRIDIANRVYPNADFDPTFVFSAVQQF